MRSVFFTKHEEKKGNESLVNTARNTYELVDGLSMLHKVKT